MTVNGPFQKLNIALKRWRARLVGFGDRWVEPAVVLPEAGRRQARLLAGLLLALELLIGLSLGGLYSVLRSTDPLPGLILLIVVAAALLGLAVWAAALMNHGNFADTRVIILYALLPALLGGLIGNPGRPGVPRP